MANKSIAQLTQAVAVNSGDLFVLEQSGEAKRLDATTLLSFLNAHGGITSIAKTATSGLQDTYTITFSDGSTFSYVVSNGADGEDGEDGEDGADGTTFTPSVSAAGVISWTNDGGKQNPPSRSIKGDKGDTGDNWYVYIKWSENEPSDDTDMSDTPNDWMGVYGGVSATAPTHYTDYEWVRVKGEEGDPATATAVVTYQETATDSSNPPTGTWLESIPSVPQGHFLWTRTVITFSNGNPVTLYSVSREGMDGAGSPSTTTPLADSGVGDVGTSNAFARADHVHPISPDVVGLAAYEALYVTWVLSSSNRSFSDSRITADSRVISCTFDIPENIPADITWTTTTGTVTLTGTINAATTVHLVIIKTNS